MRMGQSQTVEEAIAFVRDRFADIGNDLSLVETKLVSELGSIYGTEIFHLHGKCMETKTQVRKMIESLEELYNARKQLMTVIENQLKSSASLKNIEKLLEPHIQENEDTHLLELLASHYTSEWNHVDTMDVVVEGRKADPVLTPLTSLGSIALTPLKTEPPLKDITFKPISQKQFDEIPALVKRRAKMEHINELYLYLFNQAMERKRCLPIKFKDISQSGIKVYGQTGSSKLASLRHLKLVEINNREETVTLLDDRINAARNKPKHTHRK